MSARLTIAPAAINDDDVRNANHLLATHRPAGRITSRFCARCGTPWPCVRATTAMHVIAAAKTATR